MSYEHTKQFFETRPEPSRDRSWKLLRSFLVDCLDGSAGGFQNASRSNLESLHGDDEAPEWLQRIRQLSWGPDADVECFDSGRAVENMLDLPFRFMWTHVWYEGGEPVSSTFPGAMRDVRESALRYRAGLDRDFIREREDEMVLFMTLDGPAYEAPDLFVAGPAERTDDAEHFEDVHVHTLELERQTREGATAEQLTRYIEDRLGGLSRGTRWRETFEQSFASREESRHYFRNQLKESLSETMELMHRAAVDVDSERFGGEPDADDLEALRSGSVLLAFRLLFLYELERRGHLYETLEQSGRVSLDEYLGTTLAAETGDELDWSWGDFVRALVDLSRDVREDGDAVQISGGSIFENLPDEDAFDEELGEWLDIVETWLNSDAPTPGELKQWDRTLAETGELLVGQVRDEANRESDESRSIRFGGGGRRHTHRVLGNIYEQILTLVPDWDDEAETPELRLPEQDDSTDEREALGAHYTPIELVEEVVRPTLGHLFRQYWEEADEDVEAYRRRVRDMTIVDPAMGSAHFLTVAALEIARELAWTEYFDGPRFETFSNWDEPLLHDNPIGRDGGEADRDQFYREDEHEAYVERVRDELSDVIQRSIYGVDVNPIACELGKLSLWLFEIEETRPGQREETYPELTYLDANIRCGDSLVGNFLDDVDETVENALRAESSFDERQQTLIGLGEQTETAADKLEQFRKFREALRYVPEESGEYRLEVLDEFVRKQLDLNEKASGYDLRDDVNDRLRKRVRGELRWLFDLTLALEFIGYTSNSGKRKTKTTYRMLLGEEPPYDNAADNRPDIENALRILFERPDSDRGREYRENIRTWVGSRSGLRPFHWELHFPDIFSNGGFDAVVANPPFSGKKYISDRAGDELPKYLVRSFETPKTPDYFGFFFLRYDQIVNDGGAVGSLSSNSICQTSNRLCVTRPLTTTPEDETRNALESSADGGEHLESSSDSTPFHIARVLPNKDWPGEAAVHFAMSHFVRRKRDGQRPVMVQPRWSQESAEPIWRPEEKPIVSSFFDEYPDIDLHNLPSMPNQTEHTFTGMYPRGDFFIHRQPGEDHLDALEAMSERQREALAAYFTDNDIKKNPIPEPSDIVIDFYEPLRQHDRDNQPEPKQRKWLKERYPELFEQLKKPSPHAPNEESLKEFRDNLDDSSHNERAKKRWWKFYCVRDELRKRWDGASQVLAFSRYGKYWSPPVLKIPDRKTDLRICPMDSLFISPIDSPVWRGIVTSFLFEMIVRRLSSSMKSDLRFTPTNVFPYFPLPWKPEYNNELQRPDALAPLEEGGIENEPVYQKLGRRADELLEYRDALLAEPGEHGLSRDLIGGPTDLYNLYNRDISPFRDGLQQEAERAAESEAIVDLRRAHVELFQAVLRAYGWNDLADDSGFEDWGMERPWLDRTLRFVPPEPVRREVFDRFDTLNEERWEMERDMLVEHIARLLPNEGLAKSNFGDQGIFEEMPLDDEQFEEFMEWEVTNARNPRVRKDGSRWKSNT